VLCGDWPGDAARVAAIEAAGVTHFVDLTGGHDGAAGYTPWRAAYSAHAIADFGIPSEAGMRATLDTIAAALAAGGCVYLHCRAGIGRTGTVAACLLVEHGWTAADALALLQRKFAVNAKSAWVSATPETAAQRAFVTAWTPGLRSA
jgi:atypical dual specificity phosphatase